MPAINNERIKRVIEDNHNGLIPNIVRFSIRNAAEQRAYFGLIIHPKKEAKEKDQIHEKYILFVMNMQYREALRLFPEIPEEYRSRWESRQATECKIRSRRRKKTGANYTVRLVYQMLSVVLYNVWVLANIMLAIMLRMKLRIEWPKKPP